MIEPNYRFYKKKILKYLVGGYILSRNKKSPSPKYVIQKLDGGFIPPKVLLDEIKKIFDLDDEKSLKQIINVWSKNRLSKKNWERFVLKSPTGMIYYMDYQSKISKYP